MVLIGLTKKGEAMLDRARAAFLHRQNVANFKAHLLTATDTGQRKVIERLLVEENRAEAERLRHPADLPD
jgi:hypothetical protein